jgi:hypothetical protein
MLSKEQILQADDLKREVVDVPEWGGQVIVRTLTGDEKDSYETSMFSGGKKDLKSIRAGLVARSLIDSDGRRIFTDSEVVALGAKSAAAIDRIYSVAARLSSVSKEDEKELEKNSGAIPADDSISDLPPISE